MDEGSVYIVGRLVGCVMVLSVVGGIVSLLCREDASGLFWCVFCIFV